MINKIKPLKFESILNQNEHINMSLDTHDQSWQ